MEKALPDIFVTSNDYERLSSLIENFRSSLVDDLEEELTRATIMPASELPFPVVTMNSKVKFQDLESGRETEMTLVYPDQANVAESKISILAPIGIALLGLRMDEVIEWPVPSGHSRKLKVVHIEPVVD